MDGIRFDIYKEYEIIDLGRIPFVLSFWHFVAGKGAYGLVVAAREKQADEDDPLIAIKKI